MPSAKRDERIKAKQIYCDSNGSVKPAEIAERLGIPPPKIRKWKSLDGWDKMLADKRKETEKQVERSTSSTKNVPLESNSQSAKRRGPPEGNKNAVGNDGGAPPGNQNAQIHGGYSAVYWDTLDDVERRMIDDVPTDEEVILLDQIKLFYARERRLMAAISKYRNASSPLTVSVVRSAHTKREFDNQNEREQYEALRQAKIDEGKISCIGYDESTFTGEEATINVIQRLEKELSTVQRAKTQCTETLNRIRKSNEKSQTSTIAEEWIAAHLSLWEGDNNDEAPT